ncbi:capsid protein [Chifec virus UA13_1817]|uniref:Capsid protein n=1 Tax=Chifec virus UA13_1817 TaxID=2914456 RepID=A0AAX3A8D4_9CIRC|nr:capsid protein [Chifec virus UA13_1817]UNY50595.1 capsid protein [Chifec virus UA13_1817]
MARFRRVRRVLRKPVRRVRRRRIFRRRRFGRRGAQLVCKFTRCVKTNVIQKNDSYESFAFSPTGFQEFVDLAKNFNYYQFTRCRIRVIPHQNVANNSTSEVGLYALIPWHRDVPTAGTFSAMCSIDKAKIFRQTQIGSMTFVCNTLTKNDVPSTAGSGETINWMPKTQVPYGAAVAPLHYCGMIAYEGLQTALDPDAHTKFTIVQDVWVRFYQQKAAGFV